MSPKKTDLEIISTGYDPGKWPVIAIELNEPHPTRIPGLDILSDLHEEQIDWEKIVIDIKVIAAEANQYNTDSLFSIPSEKIAKNILLEKLQNNISTVVENEELQDQIVEQEIEASDSRTDFALEEQSQAEALIQNADEQTWFYLNDQIQVGPIPISMIEDLVGLGDIVAETLLWNPGLSEWKSASELGFVEEEDESRANEPESISEQEWYIGRDEEQFGPYSWSQIVEFSNDGRLHPDDYLWSASMDDWILAAEVEGLL
jgi:hypothetical protein